MTGHLLHSHHAENDFFSPLFEKGQCKLHHCCALSGEWEGRAVWCVFQQDILPSKWFTSLHSHQWAITRTMVSNIYLFCLTGRSSTGSVNLKKHTEHYCVQKCSLILFHTHLRGDEPRTFTSGKYKVAVMAFPVLVPSCLRSNFNKSNFELIAFVWKLKQSP